MRAVFNGVYAANVNTVYSINAFHRNDSVNAMVVMFTNNSTSGAISLKNENGHVYDKVVEGQVNVTFGATGWGRIQPYALLGGVSDLKEAVTIGVLHLN